MADVGAGGRPRTCEHQATGEATDHVAAIRKMMDRLHRDGLTPGTITTDAVVAHADALAAERDAERARSTRLQQYVYWLENMGETWLTTDHRKPFLQPGDLDTSESP